jgi:hypothetical protein
LTPDRSNWLDRQRYYLDRPQAYPASGECPSSDRISRQTRFLNETSVFEPRTLTSELSFCPNPSSQTANTHSEFSGIFRRNGPQDWTLTLTSPPSLACQTWQLVTLDWETDSFLDNCETEQPIVVWGWPNKAGGWLRLTSVAFKK